MVVFAAYILVTVPLLAAMAVYMVASAPRILATSWDSFVQQLESLRASWNAGDAVNVAATLLGMAVLALTAAGIVYFLYRLASGGLRRLWSWGGESQSRRVIARGATLAAAGLLAWLWMPPLEATSGQGGPLVANLRPIAAGDRLAVGDAVFAEGGLLAPTDAAGTGAPMAPSAPATPATPATPAAPAATPAPTATPGPPAPPVATPVPVAIPQPPVDTGPVVEELPADLPVELDNPIVDFELGR